MNKKLLALGAAAFFAVAIFAVNSAMANEGDAAKTVSSGLGNAQMSVTIRENGDFKVTGATVNSVDAASNSVNVSLYGFSRTVSLNGAKIVGAGKNIAIADIKVGDKLSGSGSFNASTRAITLSEVMDVSYKNTAGATTALQNQIDKLMEMVKQLQAKLDALKH